MFTLKFFCVDLQKSQNKFRISSAVVDDRGLRPRNNALYNAFAVDSRPNTTHTFRVSRENIASSVIIKRLVKIH